jgi:uncharacterized membrane protein (DUF106 family)
MSRTSTYLAVLNGAICIYFFINIFFFSHATRTVRKDVVQGILIGFALAFITAQIYARIKATKVNGWITMYGLGEPATACSCEPPMPRYFPVR